MASSILHNTTNSICCLDKTAGIAKAKIVKDELAPVLNGKRKTEKGIKHATLYYMVKPSKVSLYGVSVSKGEKCALSLVNVWTLHSQIPNIIPSQVDMFSIHRREKLCSFLENAHRAMASESISCDGSFQEVDLSR